MLRKRSTYTAQVKLQAVRMIAAQKLAVAEVARRLDVGEDPPPVPGRLRSRSAAPTPSPARATRLRPTTSRAASGPRASGCGRSGIC